MSYIEGYPDVGMPFPFAVTCYELHLASGTNIHAQLSLGEQYRLVTDEDYNEGLQDNAAEEGNYDLERLQTAEVHMRKVVQGKLGLVPEACPAEQREVSEPSIEAL